MIRLLPILLLTGVLVLHDAGPGAHEHASNGFDGGSTASRHAGHAPGGHDDAGDGQRGIMVVTCGTARLGPGANAANDLPGKAGSALPLPAPSSMDAFGAVRPSQIDHPPGYPPGRLRAFFSVYRI